MKDLGHTDNEVIHVQDVLIVGAGPAGLSAALYCARAGLSVTVLEKALVGGQMTLAEKIENYPAAMQDGYSLSQAMQRQAEQFGARILQAEIVSCDLSGEVKRLRGKTQTFDVPCVILATGAAPAKLGLAQEERFLGRGLSYCATCDGRFFKGKRVAVIGGGNSAVSEALHLAHQCSAVYLLHRRAELRAEAALQEKLFSSSVVFRPNSAVRELLGEQRLTGVVLEENGRCVTLDVDGLFVAIGRQPESAPFLPALAADTQGYLLAGEDTQTALPGVYVAGDVRKKPLRQIVTAVSDGAVAAQQALAFLRRKP